MSFTPATTEAKRRESVKRYLQGEGTLESVGKLYGVSKMTMSRWVRQMEKAEPEWCALVRSKANEAVGELHVLPKPPEDIILARSHTGRTAIVARAMDLEARTMLRKAARKLMCFAAGETDEGQPREDWNPKDAKDALLALAVLTDKVPGILALDKMTGEDDGEAVDLMTKAGRAKATELLSQVPRGLLEQALAAEMQ